MKPPKENMSQADWNAYVLTDEYIRQIEHDRQVGNWPYGVTGMRVVQHDGWYGSWVVPVIKRDSDEGSE